MSVLPQRPRKTSAAMMIALGLVTVINTGTSTNAYAAESDSDLSQTQPYIDQLRKKYNIPERPTEEAAPVQPDAQVNALDTPAPPHHEFSNDPNEVQPYIEQLKQRQGLTQEKGDVAAPIRSEQSLQPYIDELKAGRELKADMQKTVDTAAGFAIVATNKFNVHSDRAQANAFESVYSPDEKYSPSFDLFYEKQLYRNPYVGVAGLVFHSTLIHARGKGIFTNAHVASNDVRFRFYAVALSAGGSYRLTQLRLIQPYVQASLVGIPFLETRNDQKPSKRGISRGFSGVGGIALNLDWIGRKNAWAQYEAHGILHTYFIAQVEFLRSVSSSIDFNYSGLYGGFMFEF